MLLLPLLAAAVTGSLQLTQNTSSPPWEHAIIRAGWAATAALLLLTITYGGSPWTP